jgi:DNA adenine methylase
VGGKRQLLAELSRRLPKDLNRYHEPFLGGGALFFDLAGQGKIRRAFLSDANAELVNAYVVVRDSVEELIRELGRQKHSETEFYRIRSLEPKALSPVERATRLIYLNKTCYNGLYRVNSKGHFNAPFGRYKNPKICDAENLRACSKVLQKAEIDCRPFEGVLKCARRGDFAYFDPPYHPVSRTSNFAGYARGGFGESDHEKLRDVFSTLADKGCRALLSNSFSPFTRKLFSRWKIETVIASRAVNSKSSGRGPVKEILVRNY